MKQAWEYEVLIVPSGIETKKAINRMNKLQSINCT